VFKDIQSPKIILDIQKQEIKLITIICELNNGITLTENTNKTAGLITEEINNITGAEDPLYISAT